MKILIADDEPLARARLRALLAELAPQPDVVGEAGNGLEALQMALGRRPDVVLLDIRMPLMDGLECARELARLPDGPAVVFATAYDDYALEAFDVAACDYLLKPIRRERLAAALEKARRFGAPEWLRLHDELPVAQQSRRHLCVTEQGTLRLIQVDEVRYFYAEQKFTVVRTASERVVIDESLKSLEAEFPERFIRVHRNALVALPHIERVDRLGTGGVALKMRGIPERIEVSRRHLPTLREQLKRQGSTA